MCAPAYTGGPSAAPSSGAWPSSLPSAASASRRVTSCEAGAQRGGHVGERRVGHRRLRRCACDRRGLEGAVHVEEPLGVAGRQVDERRRVADVHLDPADAGAGLVRLEPPRERLEVALRAGLELPVVVDGQLDRVRRRPGRLQIRGLRACRRGLAPRRRRTRGRGRRSSAASGSSRRGQTRRDTLRFGWSGERRRDGFRGACRRPRRAAGRAPRPRSRRGRAARSAAPDSIVRCGRTAPLGTVTETPGPVAHDDEDEPRPQVAGARHSGRREEPRQLGLVEVDRRQVVRLDVRRAWARDRAHDHGRVEADHVARAVELRRVRRPGPRRRRRRRRS